MLPLDDRTIELFFTRYRDRSPHPTSRRYAYYPPMSPLPGQAAPALGGRGWDMAATIDRPEGAGGVLYASGTENSGVSLFVQDDQLVFDYNCFGDHHVVVSEDTGAGRARRSSGSASSASARRRGHPGHRRQPSGSLAVPFVMTMISSVGPSVGDDHGSPVSERYAAPFPFEGTLRRLDMTLARQPPADADDEAEAAERAAMSRQ